MVSKDLQVLKTHYQKLLQGVCRFFVMMKTRATVAAV